MLKPQGYFTRATLLSTLLVCPLSVSVAATTTINSPLGLTQLTSAAGGTSYIVQGGSGSVITAGVSAFNFDSNTDQFVAIYKTNAPIQVQTTGAFQPIEVSNAVAAVPVNITVYQDALLSSVNSNVMKFSPGATHTAALNVTNSGTLLGTSVGTDAAILMTANTRSIVTVTNNATGTIQSNNLTGAAVFSNRTGVVGLSGLTTVVNSGTMTGGRGIHIQDHISTTGAISITNSGTINATGVNLEGVYYQAHAPVSALITNAAAGSITTTNGHAVRLGDGTAILSISGGGKLSNAGTITANGANNNAILVDTLGSIALIENTGTVISKGAFGAGGSIGLHVANGTVSLVTNAANATISATEGSAMKVTTGAGITELTNAGNITKGTNAAAKAMDFAGATGAFKLTQTGTITGDILLGNAADEINLNGGNVIGALNGTVGGNKTVNIAGGLLTGDLSASAGSVNVLNVNSNYTTLGTITNMQTLKVNTAATQLTVNHNITNVATSFELKPSTTLLIKAGKTITGSVAPTVDLTAKLGFEIGGGTSVNNIAITSVNPAGNFSLGAVPFSLSGKTVFINRSGSDYVGHLARFYIVKSTGTTAQHADASQNGYTLPNTALLTYTLQAEPGQGIYVQASRATAATVDLGSDTTQSRNARKVLAELESFASQSAYLPALGALGLLQSPQLRDELASYVPIPNAANLHGMSFMVHETAVRPALLRLAALRNASTSYSAGGLSDKGGWWGEFVGNRSVQRNRDSVVGYTAGTYGVSTGFDSRIRYAVRAGLGAAASSSQIQSRLGKNLRMRIVSYTGLAYTSFDLKRDAFVDAFTNLTYHQTRQHRTIPTANTVASATFGTGQFGLQVTAGHRYRITEGELIPMMGARYSFMRSQSYREKGATDGFNLSVDTRTASELLLSAGAKFRYLYEFQNRLLNPEASFMANYDVVGRSDRQLAQFTLNGSRIGNAINIVGPSVARLSWNVGLGVNFQTQSRWDLQLRYDYTGKIGFAAHAGVMNLRYSF